MKEPTRRNDVVLLTDGGVARRNTDHPTANPETWRPPWTYYPPQPVGRDIANGATDPGVCLPWQSLVSLGVVRVLHEQEARPVGGEPPGGAVASLTDQEPT